MGQERKPSISIIIPCLNEEANLRGAVDCVKEALKDSNRFSSYEILIFNDFSTDDTGRIAEEIKKEEKGVRVIHNERNMGFGYNYTEGVRLAKKDYIIMVPGDNEIPAEAIKKIFAHVGVADIVIPYTANPEVRGFSRRVISRLFVILINGLFSMKVAYYNGTCVIKSPLLKKVPLKTWGFAYMAAILVRLLKSGASFVEVGVDIKSRQAGKTKAFRLKNIASVVSAIAGLFWEVRVKERARYKAIAKRIEA
ncbi:MAG: glycosyltransferase family 2 protein [Deltaproteobacteria bacterium]|nr:glycosyltransferase family 2 protein [Deltaproteobacteria bacterium]